MASFSGKQFRGAKRIRKDMKRNEAEVRNKKFQEKKARIEKIQETNAVLAHLEGVEDGFVS